jgi:hypothetical protein
MHYFTLIHTVKRLTNPFMNQNEYQKTCPYCEKEFKAKHLSRSYCSEKCKRRMFRVKKQEMRKARDKEKDQYCKDSEILAKLYRINLQPFDEKELVKAGFNPSYFKDRLVHEDKMLVTYENHYLELLIDGKIVIRKKL